MVTLKLSEDYTCISEKTTLTTNIIGFTEKYNVLLDTTENLINGLNPLVIKGLLITCYISVRTHFSR